MKITPARLTIEGQPELVEAIVKQASVCLNVVHQSAPGPVPKHPAEVRVSLRVLPIEQLVKA